MQGKKSALRSVRKKKKMHICMADKKKHVSVMCVSQEKEIPEHAKQEAASMFSD